VKFTTTPKTAMKSVIGAAGIAAVAAFTAATAAASPIIQGIGTSETLVDGPLITAYTVNSLQPSTVMIPGYTPKGQLWEAEVNARANSGVVTPVITNFNARTGDNQTYRVISTSPTPDALSPAPIMQGGQATGKVYFDVVGAPPTNVVYNDGVQDVLVWTASAPNGAPGQAPGQMPSPMPGPGASPAPNAPATH
jgi:opacity protein-like surface antigen